MNILKNNKGLSLLELVVATAMFGVVMLMTVEIFSSIVNSQRRAIAAQNIQESLRFSFEVMAKEIRTADGHYTGAICPAASQANKVFNNIGGALHFENSNGDCVIYELNGGRIRVTRDDGAPETLFITPNDIVITDLSFDIVDDLASTVHSVQPFVTIKAEAETTFSKDEYKEPIIIQTTISSRYYDAGL